MNRRRTIGRGITLLAALAMAAGNLSVPGATRAFASGPTSLGVTSFGRILVDAANSHVFVSSPGSSSIIVLDYTGAIVKTITGEAGAYGMALSGSTLYVALSTAGAIEKIDTCTHGTSSWPPASSGRQPATVRNGPPSSSVSIRRRERRPW